MTVPIIYLKERLEWLEQENLYLKKQIDVLLTIIANKEKQNGIHDVPEV
jgi:hypothetical protein